MRDPAEVAAAFDRAARGTTTGYALIGGLAVSAWGQPRATQDVDCLVDLSPESESAFCRALEAEGFQVSPDDFAAARRDRSHVTVFDRRSSFHVDCKLALSDEEKAQVAAAADVTVPQGRLRVARAEDTIVYKVLFGSPQDFQDVRSILVRQRGRLDLGRLRTLAQRLGVAAKVEEMLRDAGSK